MNTDIQFFVIIDAENISYNLIDPVFDEILKYGLISGKRAYADWSNEIYKKWPEVLDKYGIRPFQQFHYDKDETDKAIIMDIMEIVYSNNNINGICLIGNDHIYASIARRVRERGLFFLGIGTTSASPKLVDSCNSFIYIDNITKEDEKNKTNNNNQKNSEISSLILKAMDDIDEENINIASLGNMLKKLDPAFDPRSYGFKKLIDLLRSLDNILNLDNDDRNPPVYYISKRGNT